MVKRLLQAQWDVIEVVLNAIVTSTPGTKLFQYLCGNSNHGHSFKVVLVSGDDTFIIDPLALCDHCDKPMTEKQYASLIAGYSDYLAESDIMLDED